MMEMLLEASTRRSFNVLHIDSINDLRLVLYTTGISAEKVEKVLEIRSYADIDFEMKYKGLYKFEDIDASDVSIPPLRAATAAD